MSLSPRAYQLKAKYGITEDQYESLLQKQGGACAVCLRPASVFGSRLSVDHNHRTGVIRGLLCFFCNKFVIGRHTDPDRFARAANYLRQDTGWFVPEKPKKKKKPKKKSRKKRL